MTPEEKVRLEACTREIAEILYRNAEAKDVEQSYGCDLNIVQLLGSNRKPILIELIPELLPTSRS